MNKITQNPQWKVGTTANSITNRNAGNVGIGTTAPGYLLHLYKDTAGAAIDLLTLNAYRSSGSIGSAGLDFRFSNSSVNWDVAKVVATDGGSYGGNLLFQTKASDGGQASAPVTNMVILSSGNVGIGYLNAGTAKLAINGNVGIGTTSPGDKLEVASVGTVESKVRISAGGIGWTGMDFYNSGSRFAGFAGKNDTGLLFVSYGALPIQFKPNDTNQMTLSSTGGLSLGSTYVATNPGAGNMIIQGNVGIGTTAPTNGVLEVVGQVYFSANCSALSFTDRTPNYEGDALAEIKLIKSIDGEIDHSTLPEFVQVEREVIVEPAIEAKEAVEAVKATETEEAVLAQPAVEAKPAVTIIQQERDLGAMISVLTVGIQQLLKRVEAIEVTLFDKPV